MKFGGNVSKEPQEQVNHFAVNLRIEVFKPLWEHISSFLLFFIFFYIKHFELLLYEMVLYKYIWTWIFTKAAQSSESVFIIEENVIIRSFCIYF